MLGTFLSLYVIGSLTDVSIYAINLTTALGLGLAIDYSLFIVSRYREELRAGRSVEDAVVRTVETAGRTVTISALTVAVSLAALLVFPLYFLRSFAYAGIAVVLLAMVTSVVALPALLGRRRHADRRAACLPPPAPRPEHDGFWHRMATARDAPAAPVAVGVVAVLLFLGSPFLGCSFGTPDDRVLPESTAPARVANDQLRDELRRQRRRDVPGGRRAASSADDGAALDALAADVSDLDGVARVDGPRGTFVRRRAGRRPATEQSAQSRPTAPCAWPSCRRSRSSRRRARRWSATSAPSPRRSTSPVGGRRRRARRHQGVDRRRGCPLALAIIVVVTAVLLFLLSGSVLVPIKALVLNVLSLTATFGAMVWIFQDGNLSGLLRLHGHRHDRHDDADPHVLHRLRAVDGLRGVPALPHQGGARPHRRQRPGGGPRPRAHRAASSRRRPCCCR